ncbi:nitrous oxidase accessory protein [Halosimplex carlsbadense 2-9-1]|uniref:Nitrous oxidase accessory protein n=1 Tax=Halosimplex carlsbadense 2-9-1 TaxID=797114 RepID=M0CP25_9EURY|nr:nitrous oxide reductase family maturation protein NosD [Halosimplex carlsbadense]ELZ24995.1 nitrous oxidase accessory protein [Halosimplex carlsbadense 2-9-1]
MGRPSADAALAAVAAAILVAAAGTVVALPTDAAPTGDDVAFDAGVPESYDFAATDEPGVATVDGEAFDALGAALAAAEPGDTVELLGRFDPQATVVVETPNVTIRRAADSDAGSGGSLPVIDGAGEGDVLALNATGVTVDGVWVRNSGYATEGNDAAVWVDGAGVTVRDSRITDATFGVWVDSVADARLVDNTVVGRDEIPSRTDRGNGIQLYEAVDASVVDNRITDARDGIYYSWAEGVEAHNNTLWDLRYGVHYMYSNDCRLVNNTAVGNDAGYALMLSEGLEILGNTAVNNTGQSGHGILLKSIDHTTVRDNHVVGNDNGLFVYNSLDNEIVRNLVAGNGAGVHLSAGSVRESVHHNTFARNRVQVRADVNSQVAWNESAGNYWAGAGARDVDGDGVSETRYRPAGMVQHLTGQHPRASAFTGSPAFEVVRLAERTLPAVEAPGVVDHRPLAEPPHDWRDYYDRSH